MGGGREGAQTRKLLSGSGGSTAGATVLVRGRGRPLGGVAGPAGGTASRGAAVPAPGTQHPLGRSRQAREGGSPPRVPTECPPPLSCSLSVQCPTRRPGSRGCSRLPRGPARPRPAPNS